MNFKVLSIGVGIGIVAAYTGASWYCGHVVDNGFAVAQAKNAARLEPFIVVQRQATAGIFHSTQLLTVRVNRQELAKRWPKKPLARTAMQPSHHGRVTQVTDQSNDQPETNEPTPTENIEITVRNDISHGPLPGFSSVGVARIETHLVLSDAVRQALSKVIGDQEPVTAVTRLGFNGGGVTDIASPSFNFTRRDNVVAWQGARSHIAYGPDLASLKCAGTAPGLSISNAKGTLVLGKLSMQCDLTRIFEEIYAGTMQLDSAGLSFEDKVKPTRFQMDKLSYAAKTTQSGDYVDLTAALGIGRIDAAEIVIDDIAYDFTIKHIHGPTYAALTRKLQTNNYWTMADPATIAAATSAFQEFGSTLLEHNPELVIDRVTFTLPEGRTNLSANIRLVDFTRQDMSGMRALSKLHAVADLSVADGLLQRNWSKTQGEVESRPSGAPSRADALQAQAAQLEQQGFILHSDGHYSSHLEFKQGRLTANGKALR